MLRAKLACRALPAVVSCAAAVAVVDAAESESKKEELERLIAAKGISLEVRTEWEARRLRQIFKEVDREMRLERQTAVRSEYERLDGLTAVKLAARRAELDSEVKAELRALKLMKLNELRQSIEQQEALSEEEAQQYVESQIQEALTKVAEEEEERAAKVAEVRNQLEIERASATAALEAEVEQILDRVRLKAEEHTRQAAVHRQTSAALRCALQLESRYPALETAQSLVKASHGLWYDPHTDASGAPPSVIVAAISSIPNDQLDQGIPMGIHLEDRFIARVFPATKRWLLVPKEFDGILGQSLAYIADFLGLSAPILDLDYSASSEHEKTDSGVRAHLHTLKEAYHALLVQGDLAACVSLLDTLPKVQPNTGHPNPASDWLHHAHARLIADQSARLLRTKASLLNSNQIDTSSSSFPPQQPPSS